jgi:PAS domain S-box-containing protein
MRGESERIHELLSVNRTGVWEYDHTSGACACSAALLALLGLEGDAAPKRPAEWLSLVHPEDRSHVLDRLPREKAEDALHEARFRMRASDNQWLWVHGRGRVVERDADGRPLKSSGLILDVSDWQANAKNVAELVPVGFYTACYYASDNLIRFTYLNDQYCKITGLEKAAVLNDSRVAFASALPEDQARLADANMKSALSGAPFLFEGRFAIRGQIRWLRIQSHPTLRPNGDSEWNGVVLDITDLKAAEDALRESEERFRVLAELSPDSILVNLNGRYVYANAATVRLLHADDADVVVGLSPFDIVAPAHHDGVRQRMHIAIDENRQQTAREVTWVRRDGTEVAVEVATGPIVWAGQRAVQVVARDITERKEIEKALHDADRRKDEFLATLAHELRNPLAPIRNGLHVLTRFGKQAEGAPELLQMMERQVDHLVRLVDDLLDICRICNGQVKLEKQRCNLGEILRQAIETSQPHIQAANQRLIVEAPTSDITLDADPVRLAQVFANLLNNASKYSQRSGRIWLGAERGDDDVFVHVRDEGAGIEAELLPRVFDLFAQGAGSCGHGQGGLGVGLALVRGLVELHGGSVQGQSPGLGRGSEFTVRLPLNGAGAAETSPVAARPLPRSSRRVLIVDDDRDVGDSLGILLRCIGVDAQVVYGGVEALSKLEHFKPQLALVDLGMQGMDGYETARRIRMSARGKQLLLVALTGWGQADDRQRAIAAGFDQHFVKPIGLDVMEKLLASAPVAD